MNTKKGDMPDKDGVFQLHAQKTRNLRDENVSAITQDFYNKPFDNKKINELTQGAKEDAKKSIKEKGDLTGLAVSTEEEFKTEPRSLRSVLVEEREAKLQSYMDRLAEDPAVTRERDAKHVSLEELKAPQNERIQKVHEMLQGNSSEKTEFDTKKDYSDYKNEVSGDNKIFTKEAIEKMSGEERSKNEKAIDYQKKTVGIPKDSEAKSSGMIFVSGYTRSDGVEVKSYYRSR